MSSRSFYDLDACQGCVFWTESRPEEGGRHALMSASSPECLEEVAIGHNVQTKIHAYGGGAFRACAEGVVFFSLGKGVFWKPSGQEARWLVKAEGCCFADFSFTATKDAVLAVCEETISLQEQRRSIVRICLHTGSVSYLHQGEDFYASPVMHPKDNVFAFLGWKKECMPWEECFLYVLDREGGFCRKIGGEKESICQFLWKETGEILFSSDRTGFWNLYETSHNGTALLWQEAADIGLPLWVLGRRSFGVFLSTNSLAVVSTYRSQDFLQLFSATGVCSVDSPYTAFRNLVVEDSCLYAICGGKAHPMVVAGWDSTTRQWCVFRESVSGLERKTVSIPVEVQAISSIDKESIYGWYYPAKSLPKGLIVKCHGGPNAHSSPVWQADIQHWTDLGYSYLDVNYRGSTGFGRGYREKLQGAWGEIDVQDVVDMLESIRYLYGMDLQKVFVRGSSSGGLTALGVAARCAIGGCVVLYGVTDLESLQEVTPPFEKPALIALLGSQENYQRRSPLRFASAIRCPVLLFHGEEDRVVPAMQAKMLHSVLSSSSLYLFPQEGHGFRQSATLLRVQALEEAFYGSRVG